MAVDSSVHPQTIRPPVHGQPVLIPVDPIPKHPAPFSVTVDHPIHERHPIPPLGGDVGIEPPGIQFGYGDGYTLGGHHIARIPRRD